MAYPSSTTIKEEIEKLSRPSLKKGSADALRLRGLKETLDNLDFGQVIGKMYEYNVDKENAPGSAARDPRSTTDVHKAYNSRVKVRVPHGELAQDVPISAMDANALGDTNSIVDMEIASSSRGFFREFAMHLWHGDGSAADGTGVNLSGLDWHLDGFAGHYMGGSYDGSGTKVIAEAKDQKYFATDSAEPDGTLANQIALYPGMLDEAISRCKVDDRSKLRIFSPRHVRVNFKNVLNQLGGNTTDILVNGQTFMGYDGIPWVESDTVGAQKVSLRGGAITATDTTLTIANTFTNADGGDSFIGFSDLDVGRYVVIPGAGAGGATLTSQIASVTSRYEAELEDAAGTTVSGAKVTVKGHEATQAYANVAYVACLDPMNGLSAFYAPNESANEQTYGRKSPGEYWGTIAGFDTRYIGPSQQGGNFELYRQMFQGNFTLHDPFYAVRVSHFKMAA